MKTRIIVAAIGLPVLLVVLIVLPPIYLAILLAAMCLIGAMEMFKAVSGAANTRILVVTLVLAALVPFSIYAGLGQVGFFAIIMPLMAYNFIEAIIAFEKEREIKFTDVLISLFAGALIPYFLSSMLSLKMMDKGPYLVVLVCVITMISDSGAYFTGYYLGKHKVTPHVSPNKSLEGYIGSCRSSSVWIYYFKDREL